MDALRNLDVWKRACRFAVDVYKRTAECRDWAFRDQVRRSALSVASNIAEGYERETPKERIRHLFIAKGSCGECWTQLLIGAEAGFLDKEGAAPLLGDAEELAGMLRGLAKYFEAKDS